MSSTAILRPGIALGRYPQREDLRDGWLDRTAAGIATAGAPVQTARRARKRRRSEVMVVSLT